MWEIQHTQRNTWQTPPTLLARYNVSQTLDAHIGLKRQPQAQQVFGSTTHYSWDSRTWPFLQGSPFRSMVRSSFILCHIKNDTTSQASGNKTLNHQAIRCPFVMASLAESPHGTVDRPTTRMGSCFVFWFTSPITMQFQAEPSDTSVIPSNRYFWTDVRYHKLTLLRLGRVRRSVETGSQSIFISSEVTSREYSASPPLTIKTRLLVWGWLSVWIQTTSRRTTLLTYPS